MAKKLYRSKKDRVLVGVCGGVGDYFNVDPVLIRLAWVLASFACGAGILVYVIAAVLMPEKPVTQVQETPAVNQGASTQASKSDNQEQAAQESDSAGTEEANTDEASTDEASTDGGER